jgi:hypothetical protein
MRFMKTLSHAMAQAAQIGQFQVSFEYGTGAVLVLDDDWYEEWVSVPSWFFSIGEYLGADIDHPRRVELTRLIIRSKDVDYDKLERDLEAAHEWYFPRFRLDWTKGWRNMLRFWSLWLAIDELSRRRESLHP